MQTIEILEEKRARAGLLPEQDCSGGDLHRPALRYCGGKWRLAPWIIQHFSEHQVYVEPYGGAFSVGLRKAKTELAVYNELNAEAVNFFEQLQSQPSALITSLSISPRTLTEFETCQQAEGDPLERARRFYLFCQMSYGNGGGRWSSGTSQARLALVQAQSVDYLWAASHRLQKTQIQQGRALDCFDRFDSPTTLFYVDPPYVHSVRGSKDKRHRNGAPRRQYAYEMTDDQHRQLADRLRSLQGRVLLSGYRSALYDELFAGWQCVERLAPTSSRMQRTECLWIKPNGDGTDLPVRTFHLALASAPVAATGASRRQHRPKGSASGWIEARVGNRKRKHPTVSHYYRWDLPTERGTVYLSVAILPTVKHMVEVERQPVAKVLEFIRTKKKRSSSSASSNRTT